MNQLPRPHSLSQVPRSAGEARDCDHCGQTLDDCDTHLRNNGSTCCAACLLADGHGDVQDDYHSHARRVAGMDKVVAQLVTDNILIRSEVTSHQVEPLLRRVEALEDHVTKLQHDVEPVPSGERQIVSDGFVNEMHQTVNGLNKRLRILEACIQGIETKLKLRRKDDPDKVIQELESPNVVAPSTRQPPKPPQGLADEEPRRRWWHRNNDDDDDW